MDDQRKHYRTAPEPQVDLRIAIVDSHGLLHRARVLDVSGGGMRLEVPPDLRPVPERGRFLQIRISSSLLQESIDIMATVMQVEANEHALVASARFLDWMGLSAMVPPALARIFNLRGEPRLELDPMEPVPVLVASVDFEFETRGVLRDVSGAGMSIHVQPVGPCALSRTDRVVLSFVLPGLDRRFRIDGYVMHSELAGGAMRYGVWFDADATTDWHDQRLAIDDYVARRRFALGREP